MQRVPSILIAGFLVVLPLILGPGASAIAKDGAERHRSDEAAARTEKTDATLCLRIRSMDRTRALITVENRRAAPVYFRYQPTLVPGPTTVYYTVVGTDRSGSDCHDATCEVQHNALDWRPLPAQSAVLFEVLLCDVHLHQLRFCVSYLEDAQLAMQANDFESPKSVFERRDREMGRAWSEPIVLNDVSARPGRDRALLAVNEPENVVATDIAWNEGAAQSAVVVIGLAQEFYRHLNGRYGNLEELTSEGFYGLEAGVFGSQGSYCYRGSALEVTVSETGRGFTASASPLEYGRSGRRSFFLDESQELRGVDRTGRRASREDRVILTVSAPLSPKM